MVVGKLSQCVDCPLFCYCNFLVIKASDVYYLCCHSGLVLLGGGVRALSLRTRLAHAQAF